MPLALLIIAVLVLMPKKKDARPFYGPAEDTRPMYGPERPETDWI